jgi:hypothetical protein
MHCAKKILISKACRFGTDINCLLLKKLISRHCVCIRACEKNGNWVFFFYGTGLAVYARFTRIVHSRFEPWTNAWHGEKTYYLLFENAQNNTRVNELFRLFRDTVPSTRAIYLWKDTLWWGSPHTFIGSVGSSLKSHTWRSWVPNLEKHDLAAFVH